MPQVPRSVCSFIRKPALEKMEKKKADHQWTSGWYAKHYISSTRLAREIGTFIDMHSTTATILANYFPFSNENR